MRCGGKQDGGSKEPTMSALSTAAALELDLYFLTGLWLHGMYGLLTRKGTRSIPTGQLNQTYLCVYLM